jgi:glycosyltransferase involved in cell wall biosynthesis
LTLSLRKLFSKYQIQNPIIWTRLPTDLVWSVIQGIEKKLLIYQSIDRFPEHPRINDQLRTRYRESERSFNLSADLVFASARGLYDEKRKLNSKTFFIPNGVSEKFAAANCFPIASLEALNGPIVGFAGALGTATDNKLLATLAKAMPKVNFVFLGTIDRTVCLHGLEKLGNVTIGGLVSHHELISWFTYFDVGLIPYLINDFLHYTFPSKMAEYLMAGLPIVSTRLPEVSYYEEVVDIVDTVDEMVFAIQTIVAGSSRWDEELIAKRKQVAQGLSWETQVKKIEELIEGALVERSIANRS